MSHRCHELLDRYGDFGRLYGLAGGHLFLVRPDGHAGLLQRPVDWRVLADYVSQLRPAARVADTLGLPV